MTRRACADARAALVAGGRADGHVAACAACAEFARRLARVDAALDSSAEDAARATLAPALVARIVAARSEGSRPPRARAVVLEWALRAAAVAAILVAATSLLPGPLLASEGASRTVPLPRLPVGRTLDVRLVAFRDLTPPEPPDVPRGALPFAASAAAVLGSAGILFAVRRRS